MRQNAIMSSELSEKDIPSPPLNILHVLTLSGSKGEYGGPNKVARELCVELQKKNHTVEILTGAVSGSEPTPDQYLNEEFILVKPLTNNLPTSSLWSRNLFKKLRIKILLADIVHIHFARDLIPILAAMICIVHRKPFVTQTHGMILPDTRASVRVIDFLFTRYIMKRTKINFVLTQKEMNEMIALHFKCEYEILPNGISLVQNSQVSTSRGAKKIVFCSRLQKRKHPKRFIDLVEVAEKINLDLDFEIYGPDGGELSATLTSIERSNNPRLKYMGSIEPNMVKEILEVSDLLVLPSESEPFPMVVLESLSVGTPVLIMPSCGISPNISKAFPEMVSLTEDFAGLINAFINLTKMDLSHERRSDIQEFCRNEFAIENVVKVLELNYYRVMKNDKF